MFYDPITQAGFTFSINGALYGYTPSNTSGLLVCFEELYRITYNYIFN